MTSPQQIRKAATSLPDVAETKGAGRVRFAVRRTPFAIVEDDHLTVWLPAERAADVRADHPEATSAERGGAPFGIRVPLAAINGMHANALVRAAWLHRAPSSVAAALTDAEAADHDLPTGIGRPAIRALTGAGISTLDALAARTKGEILALHGVGPRAVRILEEHLAQSGRSWAE